MRPVDDNYYDFFADRYSYLRQFTPAFLEAFQFRSNRKDDSLLEAISVLRSLNTGKRRRVPDSAPLGFVPGKWGPYVANLANNSATYRRSQSWQKRIRKFHALTDPKVCNQSE